MSHFSGYDNKWLISLRQTVPLSPSQNALTSYPSWGSASISKKQSPQEMNSYGLFHCFTVPRITERHIL
jgi:hypothetical protein